MTSRTTPGLVRGYPESTFFVDQHLIARRSPRVKAMISSVSMRTVARHAIRSASLPCHVRSYFWKRQDNHDHTLHHKFNLRMWQRAHFVSDFLRCCPAAFVVIFISMPHPSKNKVLLLRNLCQVCNAGREKPPASSKAKSDHFSITVWLQASRAESGYARSLKSRSPSGSQNSRFESDPRLHVGGVFCHRNDPEVCTSSSGRRNPRLPAPEGGGGGGGGGHGRPGPVSRSCRGSR